MLRLVGGDVRDGGKDVGAVSSGSLDAVAVVDASLAGLVVDVKVGQIVVEVDGSRAEVATEKGGMGSEDGRYIDLPLAAERDGQAGQPFVKVSDDGALPLPRGELCGLSRIIDGDVGSRTRLAEEPSHEVAEDDRVVRLCVVGRRRDSSDVP